MTVGIAYAMGTGGHLVGAIVLNMLTRSPIRIMTDGSVHSYNRPHLFEHNLEKIGDDVVLIHSRDLRTCSELYEHTIFVSFTNDDAETIAKRFVAKRPIAEEYDIYKGADWPNYEDVRGNVPDWIISEIVSIAADTLRNWQWTIPTKPVFEIPFKQLSSGEYLEPLASYLGLKIDLPYVQSVLKEYEALQPR